MLRVHRGRRSGGPGTVSPRRHRTVAATFAFPGKEPRGFARTARRSGRVRALRERSNAFLRGCPAPDGRRLVPGIEYTSSRPPSRARPMRRWPSRRRSFHPVPPARAQPPAPAPLRRKPGRLPRRRGRRYPAARRESRAPSAQHGRHTRTVGTTSERGHRITTGASIRASQGLATAASRRYGRPRR